MVFVRKKRKSAIVELILRYTSVSDRCILVLVALSGALIAAFAPLVGSGESKVSIGNYRALAPSLIIAFVYVCFRAGGNYLVRSVTESISHRIRMAVVYSIYRHRGKEDAAFNASKIDPAIFIDLPRLREILDEAVPRFATSSLVCAICLTWLTWNFPLVLLYICLSVGVISFIAISFKGLLDSRTLRVRGLEENFFNRVSILYQGSEFLGGNSLAPYSFKPFESLSSDIKWGLNGVNKLEAFLDSMISAVAFVACGVGFYLFISNGLIGNQNNEVSTLILVLFLAVPAFLDLMNALVGVFRHGPYVVRLINFIDLRDARKPFHASIGAVNLAESVNNAECGLWRISGPSGAGKTTMVRQLCRLLPSVSYVPQTRSPVRCSLFDLANFYFGLCIDSSIESELSSTLGMLNLDYNRLVTSDSLEHLSGGEFSRLLIALALNSSASVLILDEPEAGLDSKNRASLLRVIEAASATRPVVWSGHFDK